MNIAPISASQVSSTSQSPAAPTETKTNDMKPADPDGDVPVAVTLFDPTLERIFAAESVYDPRGIQLDNSPRGVEIDRIEMIKQGFDHIRELIEKISETTGQPGETNAVLLDIKL